VNLLLFDPEEIDARGKVRLQGRRAAHLLEVLRAKPGQRLRAGLWRGPLGTAEVMEVTDSEVMLVVGLETGTPLPPRVDLVLALPRPKVLSRVIETAASFGVRRIDLVNAWRVEKAYFSSPRLGEDALVAHARLGCEQGGHGWLPEIAVHPRFVSFLERDLGPRLGREGSKDRLLAHPASTTWLEEVPWHGSEAPLTVAIGPEGGWIDQELASLEGHGFLPFALSRAVLRVESFVAAVLSGLEMIGRLGSAGRR
jgi:16S rRNA (uracil1498-N3)-methyltransferase